MLEILILTWSMMFIREHPFLQPQCSSSLDEMLASGRVVHNFVGVSPSPVSWRGKIQSNLECLPPAMPTLVYRPLNVLHKGCSGRGMASMARPFLVKRCFRASPMLTKSLVRSYNRIVNHSSTATSSLATSSGPSERARKVVVTS